jgi:choline kinase
MKKYSIIMLNALPDKKIKSLGNRCLIQIKKNITILDYCIDLFKKIFHQADCEIIIVCAFDNKKIKKYIELRYPYIKYIEHQLDDMTNIGHSLQTALSSINGQNCLVVNTNSILVSQSIKKIKSSLDKTFILTSNESGGDIGFIENDGYISNCYYGLPNKIYDIFYINQKQLEDVKKITKGVSSMFLFEIINKYISEGIKISPLQIKSNQVQVINDSTQIKKIKKQLC